MDDVDATARASLNCRNIDEQILKAQAFINQVNHKSEFTGADLLAFLIDFGIGNALEKSAALKSADQRISKLKEIREVEGCGEPLKSVRSDGL